MSAHNSTTDIYTMYADDIGDQAIADPGSNGTFNLRGRWGGHCTVASGTRKLPNNIPPFITFYVYATGNVTITNQLGTTVLVLAAEQVGRFMPKTATTWVGSIEGVGGTPASSIPVADAGLYTASTNVEDAIQNLFAKQATKFTTSSAASGTAIPTLDWTNANHVYWQNTTNGAMAFDTPIGPALWAATTGAYVGMKYLLTIISQGDNTITLTGGLGVTINGTNTIATKVTRTYVVTLSSSATASMQSVSKGTIE